MWKNGTKINMAAQAACRIAFRQKTSLDNINRQCLSCMIRSVSNRRSCSGAATVPPLNIALPGVHSGNAERKNLTRNDFGLGVQVTTLPNGIKVASEESFGPFCTLGGVNIISYILQKLTMLLSKPFHFRNLRNIIWVELQKLHHGLNF